MINLTSLLSPSFELHHTLIFRIMMVPSVLSCFIFYCVLKKSKEIKFLVCNEMNQLY